MEVIKMKLADLVKPEKNVRIHTEQQLKEFRRSVTMFGQIRPIVIDENNVILAGNGLYDTLVAMGKDTADVYRYDNLTENQKKKLMIADNKIFSLGIENLETLNSFLEDLQGDLDIPGLRNTALSMKRKSGILKRTGRKRTGRYSGLNLNRVTGRKEWIRQYQYNRNLQKMMETPPKSENLLFARSVEKRYGYKEMPGQH